MDADARSMPDIGGSKAMPVNVSRAALTASLVKLDARAFDANLKEASEARRIGKLRA
jgi:hypothetical protein